MNYCATFLGSLSTIDSYGDLLFAISMEICHELSEGLIVVDLRSKNFIESIKYSILFLGCSVSEILVDWPPLYSELR